MRWPGHSLTIFLFQSIIQPQPPAIGTGPQDQLRSDQIRSDQTTWQHSPPTWTSVQPQAQNSGIATALDKDQHSQDKDQFIVPSHPIVTVSPLIVPALFLEPPLFSLIRVHHCPWIRFAIVPN